jgi:hypothetical protein
VFLGRMHKRQCMRHPRNNHPGASSVSPPESGVELAWEHPSSDEEGWRAERRGGAERLVSGAQSLCSSHSAILSLIRVTCRVKTHVPRRTPQLSPRNERPQRFKGRDSAPPAEASPQERVPVPPSRNPNRPRMGRGGRGVARVRGAPRCVGAPPAPHCPTSAVSA